MCGSKSAVPDPRSRPVEDPASCPDRAKRWQRRLLRETAARCEAERLLETKSLELFSANVRLTELNDDLERRVALRTDELVRAAAARGDFLSAMSHEIRTPMTAVLGMIDLLRLEELTPRQRAFVDNIHASGRHLLVIINDILDFSRMESGRIELEQEDFELPAMVERVKSMLGPLAQERGLRLDFMFAGPVPALVRGDQTRISQILLNLVGNAIKFTFEGGVTVTIASEPAGGDFRLRFGVRDTGIGIAPENRRELFEAFTQADRSTTRKFGGSGLGLAISKRLVDAMGGSIGIEAAAGPGSSFWFEVPVGAGDAAAPAETAHGSTVLAAPCHILVAEDIALNRDVIAAMLERHGHQVAFAANGQEAFDLVARTAFDLLLMDVQMPLLDGVAATRLIRRLPPPAGEIPIIALTANVMAAEQLKCLQAGMNHVLMKPIDWDAMNRVIAQFGRSGERPA